MKLLLASLMACTSFAQSTGPATAQGACNAPNTGNNSTVTITCTNIDKKLADQFAKMVTASKRDAKTLKEISDKLDALLQEVDKPTVVITQNNQGSTGNNIAAQNVTVTTASWVLSDPQKSSLKKALALFRVNVVIWETNGDTYAHSFADSLGRTLSSIPGWTAEWANAEVQRSFPGVQIDVSHADFPAAAEIQRLFRTTEFGIPVTGHLDSNLRPDQIVIHVGGKP